MKKLKIFPQTHIPHPTFLNEHFSVMSLIRMHSKTMFLAGKKGRNEIFVPVYSQGGVSTDFDKNFAENWP